MMWTKITGIAAAIGAIGVVSVAGWAGFAWTVNEVVDPRFQVLSKSLVQNERQIKQNSDNLSLITYDRLVRKLRAEGDLSPRDLQALCQAAIRLKIDFYFCVQS